MDEDISFISACAIRFQYMSDSIVNTVYSWLLNFRENLLAAMTVLSWSRRRGNHSPVAHPGAASKRQTGSRRHGKDHTRVASLGGGHMVAAVVSSGASGSPPVSQSHGGVGSDSFSVRRLSSRRSDDNVRGGPEVHASRDSSYSSSSEDEATPTSPRIKQVRPTANMTEVKSLAPILLADSGPKSKTVDVPVLHQKGKRTGMVAPTDVASRERSASKGAVSSEDSGHTEGEEVEQVPVVVFVEASAEKNREAVLASVVVEPLRKAADESSPGPPSPSSTSSDWGAELPPCNGCPSDSSNRIGSQSTEREDAAPEYLSAGLDNYQRNGVPDLPVWVPPSTEHSIFSEDRPGCASLPPRREYVPAPPGFSPSDISDEIPIASANTSQGSTAGAMDSSVSYSMNPTMPSPARAYSNIEKISNYVNSKSNELARGGGGSTLAHGDTAGTAHPKQSPSHSFSPSPSAEFSLSPLSLAYGSSMSGIALPAHDLTLPGCVTDLTNAFDDRKHPALPAPAVSTTPTNCIDLPSASNWMDSFTHSYQATLNPKSNFSLNKHPTDSVASVTPRRTLLYEESRFGGRDERSVAQTVVNTGTGNMFTEDMPALDYWTTSSMGSNGGWSQSLGIDSSWMGSGVTTLTQSVGDYGVPMLNVSFTLMCLALAAEDTTTIQVHLFHPRVFYCCSP